MEKEQLYLYGGIGVLAVGALLFLRGGGTTSGYQVIQPQSDLGDYYASTTALEQSRLQAGSNLVSSVFGLFGQERMAKLQGEYNLSLANLENEQYRIRSGTALQLGELEYWRQVKLAEIDADKGKKGFFDSLFSALPNIKGIL